MPRWPKKNAETAERRELPVEGKAVVEEQVASVEAEASRPKPPPSAAADYLRKREEKAARLAAAEAEVLELAKAYEGKAVGRLVPFKTVTGDWPALVLGVETKRKTGLGRPTEVVVARVLVFNGRAQLPYINEIELKS